MTYIPGCTGLAVSGHSPLPHLTKTPAAIKERIICIIYMFTFNTIENRNSQMVAFCRKHNAIAKSENHAETWSLGWNQETISVSLLFLLTYYSLLVVHLLMHVILWYHLAQFAKKYVINTKLDRLQGAKLLSCQVCFTDVEYWGRPTDARSTTVTRSTAPSWFTLLSQQKHL